MPNSLANRISPYVSNFSTSTHNLSHTCIAYRRNMKSNFHMTHREIAWRWKRRSSKVTSRILLLNYQAAITRQKCLINEAKVTQLFFSFKPLKNVSNFEFLYFCIFCDQFLVTTHSILNSPQNYFQQIRQIFIVKG